MSTDNAYIQADMVGVSTDVSGIVDRIDVHENEAVKKGQVLFSCGRSSASLSTGPRRSWAVRNQILNLKASYQQSLARSPRPRPTFPITRPSSSASRT
jgi:membrane fusion protein (multidrug efflux system)